MLNFGDDNTGRFYAQCKSDVNSDFVNRQKSVFEKLDAVVKDKEESLGKQKNFKRSARLNIEDKKNYKRQRCDTRQFLGQESIFKRPEALPPPKFNRKIPDFKKNPQKWTKYTLGDVSEEDMSDRSNTAAAMSFLQEIKARKESEQMEVDNEVKTIRFSKPSSYQKQLVQPNKLDSSETSAFRSSKVIMPEYVIGQKQISKRTIQKPGERREKHKEIKLGHLEEDYDES